MKKLSAAFMALTIFTLLFFPSCKSEDVFNIVGTWTGTQTFNGIGTFGATFTFSGTETSGNVIIMGSWGGTADGIYIVNGLNVTIDATWALGVSHIANGTASADFNTISGTFTQSNLLTGTWTATRSTI